MKQSKAKMSLLRSLPITAAAFILSIVLFSVGSIIDGAWIDPVNILKLFAMFILIGAVNFFRFFIDGSRWSMTKPSVVKNFIFAPIYLILALLFVAWMIGFWDLGFLVLVGAVFIVVFMIGQTICFLIAKAKTDKMNDALRILLEEHEEDEKEE